MQGRKLNLKSINQENRKSNKRILWEIGCNRAEVQSNETAKGRRNSTDFFFPFDLEPKLRRLVARPRHILI